MARTVGFHLDNTSVADPDKELPFQVDFEVAADFVTNPGTGVATFTRVGFPTFAKPMKLPTPARNAWTLKPDLEFRLLGDQDLKLFRADYRLLHASQWYRAIFQAAENFDRSVQVVAGRVPNGW